MLTSPISFDSTMRELFEYPDPSFPFVVWSGDFGTFTDRTMVCHWHKEFEYGVLLSGELDYYIDGQHIHARQGDAVFINSNIIHMATHNSKDDIKIFTVSFLPSLIALECGFSSSSYFGKLFKNKYATSPTRFKESQSLVGVS